MKLGADAIVKLSEHEYDLPRYLAQQGLQGYRDHCSLCPIARYLLRETDAVEVDTQSYYSSLTYADGSTEHVEHPQFVEDFVTDFDSGDFAELELLP